MRQDYNRSKIMTLKKIIKTLKKRANPKNVVGMARFGISAKNTLGIPVPFLRDLAKKIGRNSAFVPAYDKSSAGKKTSAGQGKFEKRTGFTLMTCLAWHDKKTGGKEFIKFFSPGLGNCF